MKSEFDKYYQDYSRRVYLFLISMFHNSDLAEELTQETFYQAIKSVNKFRGECSVYTWLCRIAKNMWLRELERRKRHSNILDSEENHNYISEIPENTENPEETLVAKEGKINILKRLHGLPETEKEIILLRASGELSFKEIGKIFDKTENWARVTYYRAKQKLKKNIKGEIFMVNYPHFRSLRSLRSGGLSLSGSADDLKSPTSLECHKAD